MIKVSRFEANLLRILAYLLGREPIERVLDLLKNRCPRPPCLSRGAVALVQDALAKGTVSLLARRGGWRKERFLRNQQVVEGRLWDRTPPHQLALSFSGETLQFLIDLTGAKPADEESPRICDPDRLTLGDQIFLLFANEALRECLARKDLETLQKRPAFRRNSLCWLSNPQDFQGITLEKPLDFTPWVEGTGAAIVEALQLDLVRSWSQLEGDKERQISPVFMRQLGDAQKEAIEGFLDAAEKAERYDLARFVLRTASRIVTPYAQVEMWIGALRLSDLRLADRTIVYQKALVFLHQMLRLQTWAKKARTVHYFDDGYPAAQLFLADWEYHEGETLCHRAQVIIHRADPILRVGAN